jgi:hypothetical protein
LFASVSCRLHELSCGDKKGQGHAGQGQQDGWEKTSRGKIKFGEMKVMEWLVYFTDTSICFCSQ